LAKCSMLLVASAGAVQGPRPPGPGTVRDAVTIDDVGP
jgi:hypothetical protein